MRTIIEIRAFWESQRAKLEGALRNAKAQEQTQVATLNNEREIFKQAEARVDLARGKLAQATMRRKELEAEIDMIDDTNEALRASVPPTSLPPITCRGCGR